MLLLLLLLLLLSPYKDNRSLHSDQRGLREVEIGDLMWREVGRR